MRTEVIVSPSLSPKEVMEKDSALLAALDPNGPLLIHFYEWASPCLTFGHFIDPSKHLHMKKLEERGIELARRPTGGGIIFHLSDFAFSIFVPSNHHCFSSNPLASYAFINRQVLCAIFDQSPQSADAMLLDRPLSQSEAEGSAFCMAAATQYDLLLDGRKIGGAAQRRTKRGILHQGSVFLFPPEFELLEELMQEGERIAASMRKTSCFLFANISPLIEEFKSQLQSRIVFLFNF